MLAESAGKYKSPEVGHAMCPQTIMAGREGEEGN